MAWPALPGPAAARALALLHQLEHSQWWSPRILRQAQFRQLERLLAHASDASPFWRDRLQAAGYVSGAPLTEDVWRAIPILRRSEVQAAGQALHCAHVPPEHGRVGRVTTTGSTGRPVTVQATEMAAFFWNVSLIREHLWHRRDFRAKLAAIRNLPQGAGAYPDGHVNRGWNKLLDAVFGSAPMPLLRIDTPVAEQADWLARQNPDYLLTFPSNAEALARHCARHGIRVPRLREVRCFGEVVGPQVAGACREAWGAKVTDVYSSEELGYIAPQCPEAGRYHVQSEMVLLEVLDGHGRPCGPGQVGEVVATRLHNFATPLVRYALGDFAEAGAPCTCGRGLPVLNRIMGRTRNMLRLPDGGRLWPSFGDAGYTDIAPITQFQFAQTALERIEMRVVAERTLTVAEEAGLADLVRSRLRRPFEIVIRRCDEIPRGAGNKYEDFRCELADA